MANHPRATGQLLCSQNSFWCKLPPSTHTPFNYCICWSAIQAFRCCYLFWADKYFTPNLMLCSPHILSFKLAIMVPQFHSGFILILGPKGIAQFILRQKKGEIKGSEIRSPSPLPKFSSLSSGRLWLSTDFRQMFFRPLYWGWGGHSIHGWLKQSKLHIHRRSVITCAFNGLTLLTLFLPSFLHPKAHIRMSKISWNGTKCKSYRQHYLFQYQAHSVDLIAPYPKHLTRSHDHPIQGWVKAS